MRGLTADRSIRLADAGEGVAIVALDPTLVEVAVSCLLENAVRPDYSPMLLFDTQDVVHVSSDLGLDRTATLNLLLAHWSVFWDMRRITRVQIISRALPRAGELFTLFKKLPSNPIGPEVEGIVTSRLRTLCQLGETHGTKVMLLIPPTSTSAEAIHYAMVSARAAGLDALLPVNPLALPAAFFADPIHLNSKGAAFFTDALESTLPRTIGTLHTAVCSH